MEFSNFRHPPWAAAISRLSRPCLQSPANTCVIECTVRGATRHVTIWVFQVRDSHLHILMKMYIAMVVQRSTSRNMARVIAVDATSVVGLAVTGCRVYATMATVNPMSDHASSTGGRLRNNACPGNPKKLRWALFMYANYQPGVSLHDRSEGRGDLQFVWSTPVRRVDVARRRRHRWRCCLGQQKRP